MNLNNLNGQFIVVFVCEIWFIIFGYVIVLILASLWHLKVVHSKVSV